MNNVTQVMTCFDPSTLHKDPGFVFLTNLYLVFVKSMFPKRPSSWLCLLLGATSE